MLITGELLLVVPTPAEGPGRGWEDEGDGTMAARMFRFLQRDIDEGRIFYKHHASTSGTSDVFTFEVFNSIQFNFIHFNSIQFNSISE
jgi:hypothetical protein